MTRYRFVSVPVGDEERHARYQQQEAQFDAWITLQGIAPAGESVFACYKLPFTLWFIRHNEVLIPVRPLQQ